MAVLGTKGALRKAWEADQLSDDLKRRALAQVLERVVVDPVGPSGDQFDVSRIKPHFHRRRR
jgi:hypothetical protein